ncbi:MAG: TfoX/Sxy family protein [Planctomycetales bacterium]|nr:TfoX/Sxy family protein [Planctomycetales bacterium]
MAFNEQLAARVRDLVENTPGFAEQKMFGGLCVTVFGNMCCGVLKDDLVLRVAPDTAECLLSEPHVRPMDFTGRPLKGFLFVGAEALKKKTELRRYVSLSLAFATSLPPKAKKSGKKRSTKPSPKRRQD